MVSTLFACFWHNLYFKFATQCMSMQLQRIYWCLVIVKWLLLILFWIIEPFDAALLDRFEQTVRNMEPIPRHQC